MAQECNVFTPQAGLQALWTRWRREVELEIGESQSRLQTQKHATTEMKVQALTSCSVGKELVDYEICGSECIFVM